MSIFGQNNNQQQSSGFGGFGSNNNSNSGGFGQQSNTGGGFGGFGSGSTFGANNNNNNTNNTSAFGQQNKTSFGTSSGGSGLFGSGTTTATANSGFGGFGSSNTNNASTSGGLFGSTAKPAFGTGTNSASGLFGGGNNPTTNSTPAFGGASTGAFGSPFGQNNAVCEGTGSTPFSAVVEKEGAGAATNHFQSISTMAPYKNFSFEELRLADYNQGRRYGNASGQAGAFGSTNFSGFGQQQNTTGGFGQQANTSGGLFNSGTAASNPFSNNQSSGFGNTNTSGGGLFGSKPSGLFGTSSPATSGGLFGTSNTNTASGTTGFGSGTNNTTFGSNNSTAGGLFGSNNNSNNNNQQQQNKPFSFGGSNAGSGTGFGTGNTFGNNATNTNTSGGLFGSSSQPNSNPFGQPNNQQGSNPFGGSSGFGQQTQPSQNTSSNPFGGFNQPNQEQKPGGLFGTANNNTNTATSSGLFGNQNNNQSGGGLFGQSNNNQSTGSSLFGSKPAASGGLFGQNNTTSTNTGGGLFGNQTQNTQNQGGGLFGNSNNQQKPGGLFGNSTTGGGGLFGNTGTSGNQAGGSSLFNTGGQNQQQQQQPTTNSLFGNSNGNTGASLFGNPQQQQQQPTQQNQFQPAQTLTTSILDPNAFGSPSIFSGLPPPPQVSGPIATPITQKSKQKVKAVLPYYRLSPNHAAAYQTPTKRGYGFSYSTYGSPNSVSSIGSTPGGLGSSSLFGSMNRSLGKSMSLSNLRGSYGGGESLLSPSTFSSGSSRYGTAGSMKKLTIDRSLRTDLFGDKPSNTALGSFDRDRQSGSLKKKVSFDASTIGGSNEQPQLAITNGSTADDGSSPTPSAEEQGYIRSPRHSVKTKPSATSQAETEPIRGNELAIVPEDGSPEVAVAHQKRAPHQSHEDQIPGAYWMKPSKEALQKMPKEHRQHLANFSVGREGCGKVEFNKPVDISIYNLDDIFEHLVHIRIRSLTVYPDASKKPTLGKGMNVPSTIYLENSWPRGRDRRSPVYETDGPKMHRHVDRLRKVTGTEYVDYQKDTGTWIFRVPHFTTYALDYDDDNGSEGESLHLSNSVLTEPPDTPTPVARTSKMTPQASESTSAKQMSTIASTPTLSNKDGPLGSAAKIRLPGSFEQFGAVESPHDVEMAEVGSTPPSPLDDRNSEPSPENSDDEIPEWERIDETINSQMLTVREENDDFQMEMAGSYPLQEHDLGKEMTGPSGLDFSGDWTTDLLETIQIPKRDRKAVREEQLRAQEEKSSSEAVPSGTKKARQSMWTGLELLKSVYGSSPGGDDKNGRKKGPRVGGIKPTSTNTIAPLQPNDDLPTPSQRWQKLVSQLRSEYPIRFSQPFTSISETLNLLRRRTAFRVDEPTPRAESMQTPFLDFYNAADPDSKYEKNVWILASILFDDQDFPAFQIPEADRTRYEVRLRKDRLIDFWKSLSLSDAKTTAEASASPEEKTIAFLSANLKVEACATLAQAKNYRLATLVSQIGGNPVIHDQVSFQIKAWRDLNTLSEMSEPIRALYSLLAGETSVCEGKKAQHIEDKARTFKVSERFNLDWKRAFGLRLYYAITTNDPIESAVAAFAADLQSEEPADPNGDIMWTLLRLYASFKLSEPAPSLQDILLPAVSQSSAIPVRLSFQLYFVLQSHFPSIDDKDAADKTTKLFAAQLDNVGEWLWALFALLYLHEDNERETQIQALLASHAKDVHADPPHDSNSTWRTLTEEFKIPASWIWEAKALYANTVEHNRVREAGYLVRAGHWIEAHKVLKRVVGPECVIAEEWAQLQGLLEGFRPGKTHINDWGLGGQLYMDYLSLVLEHVEGREKVKVLERLSESLRSLTRDLEHQDKRQGDKTAEKEKERFMQKVALKEMSEVVTREAEIMKEKKVDSARKLQVPQQRDAYLTETISMRDRYYRALK